jgi:hypothetical protein
MFTTSIQKVIKWIVWLTGVSYSDDGKTYFLGLTHNQGMEAFISLSALGSMLFLFSQPRSTIDYITGSNGRHKSLTVKLGAIVQGLASLLPPAVYLTGVMHNGLECPGLIMKWALHQPKFIGKGWKAAIRAAACFGSLYLWVATRKSINCCGSSVSFSIYLSVVKYVNSVPVQRPKSNTSSHKRPNTVPCAIPFTGTNYMHLSVGKLTNYVPLSAALTQGVLYVPMFWSYYSLTALAATTTAIVFKIPAEDKILEDNLTTGPAYKRYKEKVRWSVIPYLW